MQRYDRENNNNKDLDFENSPEIPPLAEIVSNLHKNISAPVNKEEPILEKREINEEPKLPEPDKIDEKQIITAIDDSYINKDVTKGIEKKYLVFRPYIDPLTVKPYKPSDRGYYFKLISDIKIIRYTLEDNGFREAKSNSLDWTMIWCITMKSQTYQGMNKYQRINHFPKSNELTRKDLISENMNRMNANFGEAHYDFYPKTYNLPKEHAILVDEMQRNPDQWWIVKPAASAQGRGIFFTNSIQELPFNQNMVVSHYINNPMLINGYKFDLRIYVAITSVNPLRLYMYEEGLVRFATAKYKPLGKENFSKYTHLTNYSINKKNANFLQNNDASQDSYGSKWSLTALWKYCKTKGIDDVLMKNNIEEVIIKTIISAEHHMTKAYEMYVPYSKNCFEVLGFDILIDE